MMAEIQAEMARQAALDAFHAKLADEKAAAAKSTAAYQAKLASEAIEREIDEFEAELMEELSRGIYWCRDNNNWGNS